MNRFIRRALAAAVLAMSIIAVPTAAYAAPPGWTVAYAHDCLYGDMYPYDLAADGSLPNHQLADAADGCGPDETATLWENSAGLFALQYVTGWLSDTNGVLIPLAGGPGPNETFHYNCHLNGVNDIRFTVDNQPLYEGVTYPHAIYAGSRPGTELLYGSARDGYCAGSMLA